MGERSSIINGNRSDQNTHFNASKSVQKDSMGRESTFSSVLTGVQSFRALHSRKDTEDKKHIHRKDTLHRNIIEGCRRIKNTAEKENGSITIKRQRTILQRGQLNESKKNNEEE